MFTIAFCHVSLRASTQYPVYIRMIKLAERFVCTQRYARREFTISRITYDRLNNYWTGVQSTPNFIWADPTKAGWFVDGGDALLFPRGGGLEITPTVSRGRRENRRERGRTVHFGRFPACVCASQRKRCFTTLLHSDGRPTAPQNCTNNSSIPSANAIPSNYRCTHKREKHRCSVYPSHPHETYYVTSRWYASSAYINSHMPRRKYAASARAFGTTQREIELPERAGCHALFTVNSEHCLHPSRVSAPLRSDLFQRSFFYFFFYLLLISVRLAH